MYRNNNLSHGLIAYILLLGLFLQSCLNSPIPPISMEGNHQISNKQVSDKKKSAQANSHHHIASLDESTYTAAHTKAIVVAEDKIRLDKATEVAINSSTQRQLFNNSKKNPVNNRSGSRTVKKASQEKRTRITPSLEFNRPDPIKKQQCNQQQDKQLAHIFKFKLSDYSVKIYQEREGKNWQADVKEKIGYFSRRHTLSVYFETGISLEKLASLPPSIQKKYIHVILPKSDIAQKGYVYIGRMGGMGGTTEDKEEEKSEDESEKNKDKGKQDNQASKPKHIRAEATMASRRQDYEKLKSILDTANEKLKKDPDNERLKKIQETSRGLLERHPLYQQSISPNIEAASKQDESDKLGLSKEQEEKQDLAHADTRLDEEIAIGIDGEEAEQYNNSLLDLPPLEDDYPETEEIKDNKRRQKTIEQRKPRKISLNVNASNKAESITIGEYNGRKHITKIEFPEDHTPKEVAPHLVGFQPWVNIPNFVVITGKNGAGKSQLLRYINHNLKNNEHGINIILRDARYNNDNVHSLNRTRDASHYIRDPDDRKRLIKEIERYYLKKESVPNQHSQSELYSVIIDEIDKGSLPKPADNVDWHEQVEQFILGHRDYDSELHDLNESISTLNHIFLSHNNHIGLLACQYRELEHLNKLFPFYCEKKNKISDSVDSYKSFLNDIRSKEYVDDLIESFIKKQHGLLPPWEEINKILDKYKFTYRIKFIGNLRHTGENRDKNFILVKNTGQGDIQVNIKGLSSGERLMLDLMSWLFYFRGISAKGENPAQIKHLDIMLLDEPDRHLDPELCRLLYKIIYKEFARRRHIQVIMTTHRLDAVMLAPENSVYVMNKESLKHDASSAVSRMTSNVIERACNSRSAASILSDGQLAVIEDVNYVLVENKPDAKFYNIIYQKFLKSRSLKSGRTKLIFEPVGISLKKVAKKADELELCFNDIRNSTPIQGDVKLQGLLNSCQKLINDIKGGVDHGGGCGEVKKKVNKISLHEGKYDKQGKVTKDGYLRKLETKHHSHVIWGIVDNDKAVKEGKSNAEHHVQAIEEVYSFENYLCMPLNLFYYIRHQYNNPYYKPKLLYLPSIDGILNFDEGNDATEEKLQEISDNVIQYLRELNEKRQNKIDIFSASSYWEKSPLKLIGKYKIEYPKGFLIERGHDLLQGISTIFLGKEDQNKMRELLLGALQRIPVKFLPSRLLIPMKRLQHSEVVRKEEDTITTNKKADDSKTLEAIILYLDHLDYLRSKNSKNKEIKEINGKTLKDIINSENSEEKIEFVLSDIREEHVIHFCTHKLKMKIKDEKKEKRKEKEEKKQFCRKENTYTLSLDQYQFKAFQEAINEVLETQTIEKLKEKRKEENEKERARRKVLEEGKKKPKDKAIAHSKSKKALKVKEKERIAEEEKKEDNKNAFNQCYSQQYQYKEGDIGFIGEQFLKKEASKVEFIGACQQRNIGIKERIENALDNQKRVIGIFNPSANPTEYGHWITFLICGPKNNPKIYIKDSLGGTCLDFQEYLKKLLGLEGMMFKTHKGKEQIEKPELVHCGIFALQNASIMAGMKDFDLEKYEDYTSFYKPSEQFNEEYSDNIYKVRKEFAILYLQGQYEFLLSLGLKHFKREQFIDKYRKSYQNVIEDLKNVFIVKAKKLYKSEDYNIKIGNRFYKGPVEELLETIFEVDAVYMEDNKTCGFKIGYGGDTAEKKLHDILLLKDVPNLTLEEVSRFINGGFKNRALQILKDYVKPVIDFNKQKNFIYLTEEQVSKILEQTNLFTSSVESQFADVGEQEYSSNESNEVQALKELLEQLHVKEIESSELSNIEELLKSSTVVDKKVTEAILSEIKNITTLGGINSTDSEEKSEGHSSKDEGRRAGATTKKLGVTDPRNKDEDKIYEEGTEEQLNDKWKNVRIGFEYDENSILIVWDTYIKKQGIAYFIDDTEQNLSTLFTLKDNLAPQKPAGLLIDKDKLYLNHSGHSISISGPVDYKNHQFQKAVVDLEKAIVQIRRWNQLQHAEGNKIRNHLILFPYHINVRHWGLGILELKINEEDKLTNAEVEIINPTGNNQGLPDNNIKQAIQELLNKYFPTSTFALKIKLTQREKQQTDGTSCGAISAENGKAFLANSNEEVEKISDKIYPPGAKDLRRKHLQEVDRDDFYAAQFRPDPKEPFINIPPDYEILKGEVLKCIQSLGIKDKKELIRRISLLPHEEDDAAVMISIKDFIKAHSDNFRSILDLFNTTGKDWEFKDISGGNTSYVDILKMIMQDLSADESLGKEEDTMVVDKKFAESILNELKNMTTSTNVEAESEKQTDHKSEDGIENQEQLKILEDRRDKILQKMNTPDYDAQLEKELATIEKAIQQIGEK